MPSRLPIVLALLALILPPRLLAGAVSAPAAPTLVTGFWLLKGALLLLAGFLAIARREALGQTGTLLPPGDEAAAPRWATWVVGVLLIAGAVLRLYRLGEGLWFDEIQTLVDYVRLPMARILTTYDSQNQHLLYSVTARLAVLAMGESGTALRLPAALSGVASLWAVWLLVRELSGYRQALLATVLLTFSYHHVWFSQNARGYTGLLLWTVLGTVALLKLLRDPTAGWGWIAVYGCAMALAAYTHITAAFTSVAHAAVVGGAAWSQRRHARGAWLRPALGLALSALVGLVLYAPVLPQFVSTLLAPSPHAAETEWQNPVWLATEMVGGLVRGIPAGWAVVPGGVIVVAAGMWQIWRQSHAILALLLLPGLLTGTAMVALGHNLWPRFFFFSAGFAVAIAVRGTFALADLLTRRHGPMLATAGLGLLAAGSAVTVPRAWGPKQDYGAAADYVRTHRGAGDAVVTVDLTVMPYQRYVPCPCTPVASFDELLAAEREHPRLWLLYTFPVRLKAVQPELWARLQRDYEAAATFPGTVGGGDVVVMVTRSPLPPS